MRKAADPSDMLILEYLMNTDLAFIDWNNTLLHMTSNGLLYGIWCLTAPGLSELN